MAAEILELMQQSNEAPVLAFLSDQHQLWRLKLEFKHVTQSWTKSWAGMWGQGQPQGELSCIILLIMQSSPCAGSCNIVTQTQIKSIIFHWWKWDPIEVTWKHFLSNWPDCFCYHWGAQRHALLSFSGLCSSENFCAFSSAMGKKICAG